MDKAVNNGRFVVRTASRMALDHHPFLGVFTSASKGADRARDKVRVCQRWENESDSGLCEVFNSDLVKHHSLLL